LRSGACTLRYPLRSARPQKRSPPIIAALASNVFRWLVALNLVERRNLTPSQCAMAAELANMKQIDNRYSVAGPKGAVDRAPRERARELAALDRYERRALDSPGGLT
jgi:hypothetical protein